MNGKTAKKSGTERSTISSFPKTSQSKAMARTGIKNSKPQKYAEKGRRKLKMSGGSHILLSTSSVLDIRNLCVGQGTRHHKHIASSVVSKSQRVHPTTCRKTVSGVPVGDKFGPAVFVVIGNHLCLPFVYLALPEDPHRDSACC